MGFAILAVPVAFTRSSAKKAQPQSEVTFGVVQRAVVQYNQS